MIYINFLAVIIAAIASFILGGLWYGPLFGKTWVKLSGMTDKQIAEGKKKGMAKGYILMLIGSIITAIVLDVYMNAMNASTIGDALWVGFFAWLAFIATTTLGSVLWERKPLSLYLLNNGYNLLNLLIMSIIVYLI